MVTRRSLAQSMHSYGHLARVCDATLFTPTIRIIGYSASNVPSTRDCLLSCRAPDTYKVKCSDRLPTNRPTRDEIVTGEAGEVLRLDKRLVTNTGTWIVNLRQSRIQRQLAFLTAVVTCPNVGTFTPVNCPFSRFCAQVLIGLILVSF